MTSPSSGRGSPDDEAVGGEVEAAREADKAGGDTGSGRELSQCPIRRQRQHKKAAEALEMLRSDFTTFKKDFGFTNGGEEFKSMLKEMVRGVVMEVLTTDAAAVGSPPGLSGPKEPEAEASPGKVLCLPGALDGAPAPPRPHEEYEIHSDGASDAAAEAELAAESEVVFGAVDVVPCELFAEETMESFDFLREQGKDDIHQGSKPLPTESDGGANPAQSDGKVSLDSFPAQVDAQEVHGGDHAAAEAPEDEALHVEIPCQVVHESSSGSINKVGVEWADVNSSSDCSIEVCHHGTYKKQSAETIPSPPLLRGKGKSSGSSAHQDVNDKEELIEDLKNPLQPSLKSSKGAKVKKRERRSHDLASLRSAHRDLTKRFDLCYDGHVAAMVMKPSQERIDAIKKANCGLECIISEIDSEFKHLKNFGELRHNCMLIADWCRLTLCEEQEQRFA